LLPALLAITGSSVVQTWHEYSGDPLRILRNLPNAVTRGALIVVKPGYADGMLPWYRRLIRHKEIRYIANGPAIPHVDLDPETRAAIKSQFCEGTKRLVVFFGFANSRKGVERLFEIADPTDHRLALICDLDASDSYHRHVLYRMTREPWIGKARATGFLPPDQVARLLSAADAVVLPFPEGGGVWSTSAQAAMTQGTFVLVTSRERRGYDAHENVYYADPDDMGEMREALRNRVGTRLHVDDKVVSVWDSIADEHAQVYRIQMARRRPAMRYVDR
jgi:glycosyltransferase involved in cell wall biosynthesis